MSIPTDQDILRLWSHIDRTPGQGPSGSCWEWRLSKTPLGYGRIRVQGETRLAHRLAFTVTNGPPGSLVVMHQCDHPPCCRPDHLILGTRADNNHDMTTKRRIAHGINHGHAKLAESDVITIRSLYASGDLFQKQLAVKFGVHASAISQIILRSTWNHI